MVRKGEKMSEESRRRMSATYEGRKRPEITVPLVVRFWTKVDKDGPLHPILGTSCWIWTTGRFKGDMGYGQVQVDGRPKRAHRVAWELSGGRIPRGRMVLHKCDNPGCVRPSHLFLGTSQDNVTDMVTKGRKRVAVGNDLPHAKLTPTKVREMRRLYATGRYSIPQLADINGVCEYVASCAIKGRTWKHVS